MRTRIVMGGSVASVAMLTLSVLGAGALVGDFSEVEPAVPDGFLSGSDINDAGQSTGFAEFAGGSRGYLRDADGTYTELLPLGGETFSQGEALNESGDVVGGSGSQAVLWEVGAGPVALGAVAGDTDSFAVDINDDGLILGTSSGAGPYHSWIFDPDVGTVADLGTIGGATVVQPAALNNDGVAVGRALIGGEWAPWVWTEADGMVALDIPDGEVEFEPDDINAAGQIVGHVFEFIAPEGFYRAYLLDTDGTFTPLAIDGFTSAFPMGVSDAGLVVGFVDTEDSPSRTPAAWDTESGDATAFALFDDAAFTNELNAVNSSGLAIGITREGDDFDRTWIGPITPDPGPVTPTAPPAEPTEAAPDFTG